MTISLSSFVRAFVSVGKDKFLDKKIILVRNVAIMELPWKHESSLYG